MKKRLAILVVWVLASSLLLAACGGDDGGGETAAGGGETGVTEGAKTIDPAMMEGAKGEVTYCVGKDTTGFLKEWTKRFNDKYKSQGLSVRGIEFPASADAQRNQFIQRQQAKSGDCDVFNSDVIWTAEFAAQKWLYDVTPYIEDKKDRFIEAPIGTATYDGKIWGVPAGTNAGFVHMNTEKVTQPPDTWQAIYADAKEKGGIVFQGAPYEGLTVNFLELAYAAGGTVISEDGKKATINSPENVAALKLMVDAVQGGAAPRAVTTYMEPETDRAWQTGKYAYMRNWPYAYALAQQSDEMKGNIKVMPFPKWEGGTSAGILGGGNSVISVFSKNPGGALAVADFLGSEEIQTLGLTEFSLPAVTGASYDDPAAKEAVPFSAELKQAISQAKPRPVSPVYPQISQAIYENVNEALAGRMPPEEAMKKAQADVEKALATF